MTMKIEIENKYGEIIFSHECEENTIKKTAELAVKSGVSLSGANFSEANLLGANLAGANLSGANFSRTNLYKANLYEADLRKANFNGTVGNMAQIWSMQLEQWPVVWTKDILQIECQRYSFEEWRNFTKYDILENGRWALPWWKKWKDHIFKTIEMTVEGK
jgi:Pentapeptide repeats (8 copies)